MKIIISEEERKDQELLKKFFTEEFIKVEAEAKAKMDPSLIDLRICVKMELRIGPAVIIREEC